MCLAGDVDAPVWRRCRIWLSVLAFFGFIFLYAQRVGMSVAIVCMVNQTALRELREGSDNVASSVEEHLLYTNESGVQVSNSN